jgi:PPP family 3-phenylpropionic acid transporter
MTQQRWPLPMRLFYISYFLGFGCMLPYLNLHFERLGISPFIIGLLSALSSVVMVTVTPLWGMLADRLGDTRILLRILPFGAIAAMLWLSAQTSPALIAVAMFLFAVCNSPVMALADSLAINQTRVEEGLSYGRLRLHGSLGWTIGVFAMGQIVDRFGLGAIFPGYMIVTLLGALSTFAIPRPAVSDASGPESTLPRTALLRNTGLLALLAASFVLSLATQANLAFFPLYMDSLGAQPGIIGWTISLSSLTEIPFMLVADRVIKRVGVQRVVALTYGVFALQWVAYALAPSYWWLMPVQVLVGLSFAWWWVASVKLVNQHVSPNQSASAQSLFSSVSYGLASITGAAAGGYIFDYMGPRWLYGIGFVVTVLAMGLLWALGCCKEPEPSSAAPQASGP